MQRPAGVSVLAILDFIGAGFLVLAAIGSFFGMGILGAILRSNREIGSMGTAAMAGIGIVFAVILFAFAALSGVVGYGMWNLKNWARIITIVFAVLGILGGAFGILWALLHLHIISLFITCVRAALHILILWYLMQPHVRRAFGEVIVGSGGTAGSALAGS